MAVLAIVQTSPAVRVVGPTGGILVEWMTVVSEELVSVAAAFPTPATGVASHVEAIPVGLIRVGLIRVGLIRVGLIRVGLIRVGSIHAAQGESGRGESVVPTLVTAKAGRGVIATVVAPGPVATTGIVAVADAPVRGPVGVPAAPRGGGTAALVFRVPPVNLVPRPSVDRWK